MVLDRVETGAEPIGLVTSEDASKVYVAVSQSGVVEERRGSDLEVIRTFKIEHEPLRLALIRAVRRSTSPRRWAVTWSWSTC